MARPWTARVLTCLAAVPLLLTGCSSHHQAATSLPPTGAPTTTVAALPPLGPPDFPVPEAARQKTPEGVKAFANYYVGLMNHQLTPLDSSPLRDLSHNCETCRELANSYDQAKAAQQTFEGGALSITDSGSATVDGNTGETSFVLEQAPVKVRDAAGREVPGRSFPITEYTGGCRLDWDAERSTWLMAQLDADPL